MDDFISILILLLVVSFSPKKNISKTLIGRGCQANKNFIYLKMKLLFPFLFIKSHQSCKFYQLSAIKFVSHFEKVFISA